MKYAVVINRRMRHIQAYRVVKRIGEKQNIISKAFVRLLGRFFTAKRESIVSG